MNYLFANKILHMFANGIFGKEKLVEKILFFVSPI